MPGRDRLIEIVKEQVNAVSQETGHFTHAAANPGEVTEASVDAHASNAHQAIEEAAKWAKILVRESERGE